MQACGAQKPKHIKGTAEVIIDILLTEEQNSEYASNNYRIMEGPICTEDI